MVERDKSSPSGGYAGLYTEASALDEGLAWERSGRSVDGTTENKEQ